ncbi:MAG: GNAT family N-acetyltransferase [DPANN group archaeon]|nr:GNAT family N-acetyltransferase [DPANN group archaeon]
MPEEQSYIQASDLSIRSVMAEDLEQLLPILYQLSPLKPHETEDKVRLAAILEEIIADKNHHMLVCEYQGKIIGTATLLIQQSLTHGSRPYGHIENVVTHVDYRQKKGVGKMLVTKLHEIAKQHGCHKVVLACQEGNVPFYEKCSMGKTGEVEMRINL